MLLHHPREFSFGDLKSLVLERVSISDLLSACIEVPP